MNLVGIRDFNNLSRQERDFILGMALKRRKSSRFYAKDNLSKGKAKREVTMIRVSS